MATADAKIRIVAEDKTQKAFRSVDKNLNKTSDALKGLAKRFIFAAGAAGVGGFVTSTIHAADRLDKLSLRLGVSTKALSEYKHVAEIGGVTFETLTMAWQRMTRRIAEAAIGMGEAKDALKELGLNAKDLNELPLDEKFEIVADALAGLGSESDRVRLAMKLFDSEGVSLIQTMEGGAKGIRKVRQQARDLGLTLDETTTKAAAKLVDEMTNIKAALQGIANSALPAILPLLTNFALVLQGGINALKDWGTELKFLALVFAELFVIKKITPLIIAMSGAMKVATFSARGLGIALKGMLGGIPGLIAMAATAWMMFRDDTEEATKAVEEQTEAVKKLRKEFAGMNLDQLTKQQRKLKMEFAEVSAELIELNVALDEQRDIMSRVPNATGLKSFTDAAKNLQTAIVEAGEAVQVLSDPELVALQDRYAELEALLAEVEKQIDDVTKSTDESAKATDDLKKSIGECTKEYKFLWNGVFDLEKLLKKPTVHQAEKEWEGMAITLSKAEQAMKDFKDEVADTQFESDILIDKMEVLDQLFQDGAIDGDTYTATIDNLSSAMGDAGEETVLLTQDVEELQSVWEKMVEGIDSAWTDMWVGLFKGEGINSVKDFLKQVKNLFLQTLAEIAAEWTKKKLIDMITGGTGGSSIFSTIGSIFTSGGETAGGGFISGISTAISTGASKIGAMFGNLFGASTSSGALVPGAAGGFQTVGANAATTFMGGLKTTLSSAAGFAVPLAIAAFGFGKSRKFRKQLRAKFASVMSDPTIVANLADGPLAGGFRILGQVGDQTFAQIGSASSQMFRHFSETSGGVFKDVAGSLGVTQFMLKEMHDEFGNVVITAQNFSGLLEYMEEMEPFSKHAQHLIDTIPAYDRARDSISLIDSELLKAKVQFKNMGDEAKTALAKVDMGSQRVANIMQRDFVTAADFAAMGMENLGSMSSSMFEKLISFAQDASGEMQNLATMANRSAAATQGAMDLKHSAGFQHGGSFLVGGGGGTDSQRVSFMATPGERVSIETPNQSKASGSDGSGVVRELRALRHDLATVVAKPIVGAVTRGQLAMAGGARH